MAVFYPMLYGYRTGTLEQMMFEVVAHGHPEFVRRLRIWLIDQGGRIGVGDAWRAPGTQPNRPGFAPEGRSFHQDQRFASGFVGCSAVDLVVIVPGSQHRAPMWKEVPKQGSALAKRYGLHCNIDGEPWHMQPIEIDGWQNWVNDGREDPLGTAPPPPPGDLITSAPPASLSMGQPVDDDTLHRTRWLQQICNERFGATLPVDGQFGQMTKDAVEEMQRQIGASDDGQYGPKTATKLADWLALH